jgi:hypothetical protein
MILADLLAGESVFLDANIWIYHFSPHPTLGAACNQLVRRIEGGQLPGFTSTHVLAEVAHQMMILEASALPGWTLGGVRQRLQKGIGDGSCNSFNMRHLLKRRPPSGPWKLCFDRPPQFLHGSLCPSDPGAPGDAEQGEQDRSPGHAGVISTGAEFPRPGRPVRRQSGRT